MAPAHFIHKRRFLRRWRFEELLQQDLKNGIVLAACMRGAGHRGRFCVQMYSEGPDGAGY